MFKMNWKRLGMAAGLSLTLFAAGCGSGDQMIENTDRNSIVGDGQRN